MSFVGLLNRPGRYVLLFWAIAAVGIPDMAWSAAASPGDETKPTEVRDPSVDSLESPSCSRFVHASILEDERTEEVQSFFDKHSCQIANLAADFVLAADLNQLDYRLLPALAVLESGCGRATRNNNLFGWGNGKQPFSSFRASIYHVARRLRLAPHYAGKTLVQKLRVYNRRAWYRRKVLAMMETMTARAEPGDREATGSE